MRARHLLPLLAAAACAPAARTAPAPARSPLAELRVAIDSMIAQPEFRNAHWGILIVDPERGDTLYSHEAGKLFMPASNMKIVTGATALAQLGPDFRFRTTVAMRGAIANGVLRGDLVIHGRGDPSFSDHMRGDAMAPMRDLADSLAARGIHRITGQLLPGDDIFPGATLGFGWSWDDLGEDYSAGVDELFFNEGFAPVILTGGVRAGDPVRLDNRLPVPAVRGDSLFTAPADSAAIAADDPTVRVLVDTATGAVALRGTVPPDRVDTVNVVFPRQEEAYLAALAAALRARGITVDSATRSSPGAPLPHVSSAGTQPLFTYWSPPLRDVLHALEKPSQNQIAEILLRTLGLERGGAGTPDSGRAVVERQLLAWGAARDGFVIRDGSGLSRYDYVSPETLVHVLTAIRRDTAFAAFYDALPIAGVDGTIAKRMRGTLAAGNMHAKTGSIANARSLSGYVTTADGRVLVFSMLANNWTVPASHVLRVQDAIGAHLAALTLKESH